MASAEQFLQDFTRAVEPKPVRKEGAKRSHTYLRSILRTGQFASRIQDDYLSGSYSRDTAIDPLEDVDIIFLIDQKHWQSGWDEFFDQRPDPNAVLQSFQNAIRYRYAESSVVSQRRSVGLRMHHLDIDVVPAISHAGKDHHIWIPDKDEGTWIVSGPKVHASYASLVNERSGRKFKPLVKLLKYWNRGLPTTAAVKSFTIETMAVRLFHKHPFDSLEEGLLKFFDFILWLDDGNARLPWRDRCGVSFFWGNMNVPDVADTGANVAANVNSERRRRFVEKAHISRDRILEAAQAATVAGAESKIGAALRIP